MLAVIGGHSRGTGKTAVICGLLRALPEGGWTVVKLSPHHSEAADGGDTARYLAAGAARAALASTAGEALATAAGARNAIVESNRIVDAIRPDLYLFVVNPAVPFKDSAWPYIERADVFVVVGTGLPPAAGRPWFRVEAPEYASRELTEFVRAAMAV